MPLILGCTFTPAAMLIAFISGGTGHGSYVGARLLLPFACMDLGIPGDWRIILPLAILQWPLYGLALSWPRPRNSLIVAVVAVSLLHVVGVVLMFTVLNQD